MVHLRKHGLDPNSLDLDAMYSQSTERGIPAPSHFVQPSPDAENKRYHESESRSASPSFPGDSTSK